MSMPDPKVDEFLNRAKAWHGEIQKLRSCFLDCGLKEDLATKVVVKAYIKQAIAVEKAGLKVAFKAKAELELPEELTQILKQDGRLAKAFYALTPGRQRAYVLHFTGAKQSQTRTARIEKYVPRILAGMGMNDR